MSSSTGCNNGIACQESIVEVIYTNHADYDCVSKNETTGKFSSCLFLYSHSVFERLCTACTAKSDVSQDTLRIYIL